MEMCSLSANFWTIINALYNWNRIYIFHESDDEEAKDILRTINHVLLIDTSFKNRFKDPLANWQIIGPNGNFSHLPYVVARNWTQYDEDQNPWERIGGIHDKYTFSKFDT